MKVTSFLCLAATALPLTPAVAADAASPLDRHSLGDLMQVEVIHGPTAANWASNGMTTR